MKVIINKSEESSLHNPCYDIKEITNNSSFGGSTIVRICFDWDIVYPLFG